ncbi:serine carboxypeptidase-like 50 [Cryptomeria japonica]|uniref:serine carboxypeptidase-like 50 n=1 Tax=Cryptomeria japonica TaxID=3369 RepID=UPI0027DA4750|nr:serine carboxypeptidase-like 50 [Cryptomeria japonica]
MKKMNRTILSTVALLIAALVTITNAAEEIFPKEALPMASGYLTIKEKPGAQMFYAYYEAIEPALQLSDRPIVLWLQGGPGCSGLIGNLYELGPWRVAQDLRLHKNSAPWNRVFGLLFLDNPIGSGFSVAPTDQDIPSNQEEIAKDLYSALQAFYDLNPLFKSRPFFVTGESYAGKYVPSLAYYMVEQLEKGGFLRIDGAAIGNGFTHPVVQVQAHASVAYAVGLIDYQQKLYLESLQEEAVSLTTQHKWNDARIARNRVLGYLKNRTGLATLDDMRRTVPYYKFDNGTDYLRLFVNQGGVKEALNAHPTATWVSCRNTVRRRMREDIMKSTKWKVERLLLKIPVLLYQGQFDLRDGVLSTEDWMRTLEWNGLAEFWRAERKVWRVSKVQAGYVRSYSNLTHVVVARAGHLVPADQNLHSQVMIESWVAKSLATSAVQ